jgi:hypothetical protein
MRRCGDLDAGRTRPASWAIGRNRSTDARGRHGPRGRRRDARACCLAQDQQGSPCTGGPTWTGTSGNDTRYGNGSPGWFVGLDGDDTLLGGGADYCLEGGAGNDRLGVGSGPTEVRGDDGDDTITLGTATSRVLPGPGADRISGGTAFAFAQLENDGARDTYNCSHSGSETVVADNDDNLVYGTYSNWCDTVRRIPVVTPSGPWRELDGQATSGTDASSVTATATVRDGVGVRRVVLEDVGRGDIGTLNVSCQSSLTWTTTGSRACPLQISGTIAVNAPALAEGLHTFRLRAENEAGDRGYSARLDGDDRPNAA